MATTRKTSDKSFMSRSFLKPSPPGSAVIEFIRKHRRRNPKPFSNEPFLLTLDDFTEFIQTCNHEANVLLDENELIILIRFFKDTVFPSCPLLKKHDSYFHEIKYEAEQNKHDTELQAQVMVGSLTKGGQTTEYNRLARLCCSVARLAVRSRTNSNPDFDAKLNDAHSMFYSFGQTCDCSHGGDMYAYDKLLSYILSMYFK
jgi:hypothetical protein